MKLTGYKSTVVTVLLAAWSFTAFAQDDSNSNDRSDDASASQQLDGDDPAVEVIVVTGSRLSGGDRTARVEVIGEEMIKALGVSTAEDILRSIPQNFAAVNSSTNQGGRDLDADPLNLAPVGVGVATANLRGLGSDNTLVLINGHRVAGIDGNESGAANLANIPAAAIEQVEVVLDGASAIYGSDAVGGVINIITRKNYSGATINARYENSNTDADARKISITAGHAWGSGSITGTLSYDEIDMVDNRKAGWTTSDYSSRFGGDQNFNLIPQLGSSSPGIVGIFTPFPSPPFPPGFGFYEPTWVLPPGHDGVGATPADFISYQDAIANGQLLDYVKPHTGNEIESTSANLHLRQSITDRLDVSLGVLWSEVDSSLDSGLLGLGMRVIVPASNAYNPFGEDVQVEYLPHGEMQTGVIPEPFHRATREQLNINLGFDFAISDDVKWVTNLSRSTSEGDGQLFRTPTGVNSFGADFVPRFEELLSSSDPSVAINLFGNGTAQSETFSELIREIAFRSGTTELDEFSSYITGDVFQIAGGDISASFGGEFRTDRLKSPGSGLEDATLGPPERDLFALFGEISVPLVSSRNSKPWARDLTVSLQLRYDEYTTSGAVDRDATTGELVKGEAKFDNVSPRIGVRWSPNLWLGVRASWTEAFRAPAFTDLFNSVIGEFPGFEFDPLAPAGTSPFVPVTRIQQANPGLKPEFSDNYSVGVELTPRWLDGLLVTFDYSKIDFQDRIISSNELLRATPLEAYADPRIVIRDPVTGVLTSIVSRSLNQTARVVETLDTKISYIFDTPVGDLLTRVQHVYVLDQYDQFTLESERLDRVGSIRGLDRYRLRGQLSLQTSNDWRTDLWINYTPSYRDDALLDNFGDLALGFETVPSYLTVDLTVARQFDNGLSVRVGARNLLDRDFPFAMGTDLAPWDASRVDPRKRILFGEVNYSFGQ